MKYTASKRLALVLSSLLLATTSACSHSTETIKGYKTESQQEHSSDSLSENSSIESFDTEDYELPEARSALTVFPPAEPVPALWLYNGVHGHKYNPENRVSPPVASCIPPPAAAPSDQRSPRSPCLSGAAAAVSRFPPVPIYNPDA